MERKFFRVMELAEEFGLHPDTIRKLERKGVIKARRDRNNHRIFSDSERAKLSGYLFPQEIKGSGFQE